jgi:hypothetical protein
MAVSPSPLAALVCVRAPSVRIDVNRIECKKISNQVRGKSPSDLRKPILSSAHLQMSPEGWIRSVGLGYSAGPAKPCAHLFCVSRYFDHNPGPPEKFRAASRGCRCRPMQCNFNLCRLSTQLLSNELREPLIHFSFQRNQ